MIQEQLIYEIAGEKYILIDIPIIEGHSKKADELIKKYGLVYQGVKEINRGGFWSKAFTVQRFFLPEKNFDKWKEF